MIREVKELLSKNTKNIIYFQFIFKIFTLLIAIPLFLNCFKLIMNISGYSYLTFENIISFILNPLTLLMLLIIILILGFYSVFDIGTIIILLDSSKQNKEIELKDAISISLKKSLNVFNPKNLGILIFVLFLIPFLNLGIGSSVITSIKIPEFIMDYINANNVLSILYIFIVIVLLILSLNWLYSIHYYFLENKKFNEACKSSRKLSSKKHLKDILCFVFLETIISLIYLLFIIIGIVIIIILNKYLNNIKVLESFLISIVIGFILISMIIFSIIDKAIAYACISMLFYRHKKEIGEKIKHINIKNIDKKITKSKWNILKYSFLILGFLGLTTFTYGVIKGEYNLNIEYIRNMEITAHRGASVKYPENTFSAFIGAKELGADWIELDVQETKDGIVIVSHDSNLKRVSGVDLNIYEATYKEISKLDVGSFKDRKYSDERVPLFEEVVKWAKENNMKLNVEIKPTGYEKNLEKNVVEIIKDNNYKDYCVVTSQVYDVLEKVKKIDKNIKTVYVTSFAYGNITKLEHADYFSVEATSITKEMVSLIHKQGKQIYGWTVNTEEGINKMINLGVDNIITDDISLGKELVIKSKSSDLITETVNLIQEIFG